MLDIENRCGIAILHMRQEGANRLDVGLLRRLTAALEFVRRSRAVVLIGYGGTFAVGTGLAPNDEMLVAEQAAVLAVARHPRPVVAAVNGDALDAGFALAAAADVRIMARGQIGLTREAAGLRSLTAEAAAAIRCAAGPLAESMLRTGGTCSADEAATLGLVEQICTPVGLLDEAVSRAGGYYPPSAASMADTISSASGSVRGRNRATT